MTAIVCIVGKSNSGKTTLLEHLIPAFKAKGYRVGVVKHASHGFRLDPAGTDSWRLARAGGDTVAVSSPQGVALLRETGRDLELAQVIDLLEERFDLVLAEGFKQSPYPKVEVHRQELGPDLLMEEEQLAAAVSDGELGISVKVFRPEDAAGLAEHLDELYLKPQRRREQVFLSVNGQEIQIVPFAQAMLANALVAMVSTLKGVGKIVHLRFSLYRPPE